MSVEYREIPGSVGYRVGSDGSVWSRWIPRKRQLGEEWRRLKPCPDRCGYLQVEILKDGRRAKFMVHCLVLESFVGPCPEGMECLHADDNKANCTLVNLAWGTHAQNMHDASVRDRLPQNRLSDKQRSEILSMRGRRTAVEVAAEYKISKSHAARLMKGIRGGARQRNVTLSKV